ncbi:CBS domain-containing protein [Yinghuangia aomiensis]
MPVVAADGRILGVVSEADLLCKEAHAADTSGTTARRLFGGRGTADKSRAEVARDLMTSPAVTVRADGTVVDAARLMERRGVKRLPVVDADGRLEGVVSRCDLLRVPARRPGDPRRDRRRRAAPRAVDQPGDGALVTVDAGRVHLAGSLETRSLVLLVVRLVPGGRRRGGGDPRSPLRLRRHARPAGIAADRAASPTPGWPGRQGRGRRVEPGRPRDPPAVLQGGRTGRRLGRQRSGLPPPHEPLQARHRISPSR